MDRERLEAKQAMEKATELLETKAHHPFFHLGHSLLTIAARLFHEGDFKGAFSVTVSIFKLDWRESPPVQPVAPNVVVLIGRNGNER